MSAYIDQADLEARLSVDVVRSIYDDDNSGTADAGPIARLIADASSKVDSYLLGIYELPLPVVPNEVKRLTLDVACAMAAQRHAEYVRFDDDKTMKAAEADLLKLRRGETRLDLPAGSPTPGNLTARSFGTAGDPVVAHIFTDGMGDF